MPALVFGEALFERGHGAAAFGDLVKDFAVGEGGSGFGVREVGGEWVVELGFGAVSFAAAAMAIGAVFLVDEKSGVQIGIAGQERVF